jgi:hemerythrin-like metal-binding protein
MAISTPTFRWTEKYAVNVQALDNQHRTLFASTNELNDALSHGEGAAAVDPVLQRLVDYALSHFAAEEALMKRHRFPDLAKHRAEHEAFARKVTEFIEEYRAGRAGVPVELLLFLQSWLKQHILVTDKAYSSFLNERGVR